jgi:hypothetical protein
MFSLKPIIFITEMLRIINLNFSQMTVCMSLSPKISTHTRSLQGLVLIVSCVAREGINVLYSYQSPFGVIGRAES